MNETGYRNLIYLVSKGYLEGFYYKPRIDHETLREFSEGLIGLSACPQDLSACNAYNPTAMAIRVWSTGS